MVRKEEGLGEERAPKWDRTVVRAAPQSTVVVSFWCPHYLFRYFLVI